MVPRQVLDLRKTRSPGAGFPPRGSEGDVATAENAATGRKGVVVVRRRSRVSVRRFGRKLGNADSFSRETPSGVEWSPGASGERSSTYGTAQRVSKPESDSHSNLCC